MMLFSNKPVVLLLSALAASQLSAAWICVGIMEEDYCNMLGGCTRAYYKTALQDGNLAQSGGSGIGYNVGDLCGTYFDGIGTLNCWGNIWGNCEQNVASLGGFNCRTRCNDDKNCQSTRFPQLGQSAFLPPSLVCA